MNNVINNRGVTLIELALVVSVIGLTAMISLPKISEGMTQQDVRGAANTIASMHAKARAVAIRRGSPSVLVLTGGALEIRAQNPVTAVFETVGTIENLDARFRVVTATTRDSIYFDARGLGTQTSSTYIVVSRQDVADTLRVSKLGRVLR